MITFHAEKIAKKKFHNLSPFIRRVIFVVDNSSSTRNYSRMSSNIGRRFKDSVSNLSKLEAHSFRLRSIKFFARCAFIDGTNKEDPKYLKI